MRFLKFIAMISILVTTQLFAESVTYKIDGKDYEGYLISKGSTAPVVLIAHDWDGLTDYEVRRANMLSNLGYSVFAIDLFGKGIRPTKVKDKKQHTGELYQDRKKMRKLMTGSIKFARERGLAGKKVFAIGYCFGGAAVLELARSGIDIEGIASFHGGLKTPEGQDYSKTKSKILVFHGTADSMISMSDFANLADQLEKNKIDHQMSAFGGAPHAFTVFDSKAYRKEADYTSWNLLKSFLERESKNQ